MCRCLPGRANAALLADTASPSWTQGHLHRYCTHLFLPSTFIVFHYFCKVAFCKFADCLYFSKYDWQASSGAPWLLMRYDKRCGHSRHVSEVSVSNGYCHHILCKSVLTAPGAGNNTVDITLEHNGTPRGVSLWPRGGVGQLPPQIARRTA